MNIACKFPRCSAKKSTVAYSVGVGSGVGRGEGGGGGVSSDVRCGVGRRGKLKKR